MEPDELDRLVRLDAFAHLARLTELHGEVLPLRTLREGFTFRGERVRLVGPQGIFKPRILQKIPLSITTVPPKPNHPSPYDDTFGPGGLRYRYRGTDPDHHENVGLRAAMTRRTPLIYFHGIIPGRYFAVWPVFVIGDEPRNLTFHVAVDDAQFLPDGLDAVADADAKARRQYVTVVTRARLHQRAFRERVLAAYRQCCALCRLRHSELLDAAHILPDSDPRSLPVVSNGLALCKLHHAAFDRNILGVRPDCVAEVREDILREIDGPMLIHGLQGFHGATLWVPRSAGNRPDPGHLAERYEAFLRAG